MSCLVVRMYLNAEILTGVDKLDEQGKLIAKVLVVVLTNKFLLLFTNQLVKALALVLTCCHNGLTAVDA